MHTHKTLTLPPRPKYITAGGKTIMQWQRRQTPIALSPLPYLVDGRGERVHLFGEPQRRQLGQLDEVALQAGAVDAAAGEL